MANPDQLKILQSGMKEWNQWRQANPDVSPDLSGAVLREVNLSKVNLSEKELIEADIFVEHLREAETHGVHFNETTLRKIYLMSVGLSTVNLTLTDLREADLGLANLSEADLTEANLYKANLYEANLSEADLSAVNLGEANLRNAALTGACLRWAILKETRLSGAVFSKARLAHTVIANTDLSEAIGLETVVHHGPSTIGIDTLYRSKGKIPEIFLRGAGVPETLIEYLPSLITGKAIQYYSVFISYSTKDADFAKRLYADLQSRGVRCWFAPEEMKGGKKIHEQITQAIRLYDKLLLVLSENSMHSEWVETEIYHARQSEIKENRRKLFPIALVPFEQIRAWQAFDADTGKDLGREIREYYIPDFSHWKEDHDSYQREFDRLISSLNLDEVK